MKLGANNACICISVYQINIYNENAKCSWNLFAVFAIEYSDALPIIAYGRKFIIEQINKNMWFKSIWYIVLVNTTNKWENKAKIVEHT